jgi:cell filamentation protein
MSPFANDPYCYPGTDVLINLENIRDQKTLNQFEAQTASASIAHLTINPIKGPFNIRRLQETYRRIFGKVYPWAGEIRKYIGLMAKNRSGFVVAYGPSQNVPGALASTFAALKKEKFLLGLYAVAMARGWPFITANSTPFMPFGTGIHEPCASLRLILRKRRAIGSTGLWQRRAWKIGSGCTMPATWL